jgi:hypothetical protein
MKRYKGNKERNRRESNYSKGEHNTLAAYAMKRA